MRCSRAKGAVKPPLRHPGALSLEGCRGALGTEQLMVLSAAKSSYSKERDVTEQEMAQLEQKSCCHLYNLYKYQTQVYQQLLSLTNYQI